MNGDENTTRVALIICVVLVVAGLIGILVFSGLVTNKPENREGVLTARLTLALSIIATIVGLFGGVPGIKELFFNSPVLKADPFLPSVIFDAGSSSKTKHPKFWLGGLVRILNSNDKDIVVSEIRMDGRTQDTSGRYRFKDNNKPMVYELHVTGTIDEQDNIIRAHSSAVLKFKLAHFDNTDEPGIMRSPMKTEYSKELEQMTFVIYIPSFNQLFKFNEDRIPFSMTDASTNGFLTFSIVFNNELIKTEVFPQLNHYSLTEWDDKANLTKLYNAAIELQKK